MAVEFQNAETTLSATLAHTAETLTGEKVTVRQLMESVGEQGLLFFCMILTIPFLLPVSIPGVSTVFGLVIILIGIGITLNRLPWLPSRLMQREMNAVDLRDALAKGSNVFARLDRIVKPRMSWLTEGAVINRVNGLALIFAAVLLMFPLGLIPFSNTLPGLAILFLAVGMLQRDGFFILLGYLMIIATIIYFGALAIAAIAAGQGIGSLLSSG
jgi:hypothetical protein